MYSVSFLVWSLFSSATIYIQNDMYNEPLPLEEAATDEDGDYDFAPDVGSPGVEVAPLDVNDKDEDVPYPDTTDEEDDITDEDVDYLMEEEAY